MVSGQVTGRGWTRWWGVRGKVVSGQATGRGVDEVVGC